MEAYLELERRFARCSAIEEALGVLQWDTQTMMPHGAIAGRSDQQLAALTVVAHEILADSSNADLLACAAEDRAQLSEWQAANLREMQRRYVRSVAIPSDLLEASSKAASTCQHVWETARADSDFASVLPYLEEVVRTQKEIGSALGAALGLDPYDALLDMYDPGSSRAAIDRLFDPFRPVLPGLIGTATEHQKGAPKPVPFDGRFSFARQEALGRTVLDAIGFDFDHGRLDVSTHPFTGGAFGDVRITTRYDEADFMSGLFGTIHESGHALYEQGRPAEWRGQPVGESRGMVIHESQSLSFEMQAARSAEFFAYLAPLAKQHFGGEGSAWTPDNMHRLAIAVKPGFIRVEADEVTYPAHVLIRYEIEKAVMAGTLALGDLPAAFNEGIRTFLGLDVPDDRRGCLQDIHWYSGAWGYFPTYLLGAMTAAQLFAAARRARPEIPSALARGDFAPVREWMRTNIHRRGSLLDRDDLIVEATGSPLDSSVFRSYLQDRYCND